MKCVALIESPAYSDAQDRERGDRGPQLLPRGSHKAAADHGSRPGIPHPLPRRPVEPRAASRRSDSRHSIGWRSFEPRGAARRSRRHGAPPKRVAATGPHSHRGHRPGHLAALRRADALRPAAPRSLGLRVRVRARERTAVLQPPRPDRVRIEHGRRRRRGTRRRGVLLGGTDSNGGPRSLL